MLCGLALVILVVPHALADVVETTDGRRFEGRILENDDSGVLIDAVVGGVRCTVKLDKDEIKSVEEKAPPEGFFETEVADAGARVKTSRKEGTRYLEVPIVGEFGRDVFADGVLSALRYARQHRIPHVVFVVDSTGGDLDEAAAAYKGLKNFGRNLTYHSIVKNCTGDALIFPIWSDDVYLLPGARIGGSDRPLASESDRAEGKDERVLRAQIANEVAEDAALRERAAEIVRAMIDPSARVAAWRDDNGEVQIGETLPDGVSGDGVIFENGPDTVLVLNREQAAALGVPTLEGTATDLGPILDIADWTSAGDFGEKAMTRAAEKAAKEAATAAARYANAVEVNLERRGIAERYIEENMRLASEWDPTTKSDYGTYSRRWKWGWGRRRGRYRASRSWSQESQERWKDRTDACIHYLTRAVNGIRTMQELEAEAEKLDLVRQYDEHELEWMLEDISTKIAYLEEHRDRRGD